MNETKEKSSDFFILTNNGFEKIDYNSGFIMVDTASSEAKEPFMSKEEYEDMVLNFR